MFKLLAQSAFQDNELSQKSQMLSTLLLGSAGIFTILLSLVCFILPQHYYLRWILCITLFDVSCLGIYFLNKKGAFRLGTILFVNILILMVFIFSWTAGGIKAPAIQFFPFPVLIAVLLLGKRAGLLIACEAALCGLMLVVCDHFGILPSSTISHTTVSLWLISVLCITLLALLESISLSGITHALKRAQEELKRREESEAHYRFIAENTDDVIWSLSLQTNKFTYLSPSVFTLRGFTPEECMTQTMADALTPESLQSAMALLQHTISERTPGDTSLFKFINQLDQNCKDGSVVSTEVATTLVFDKHGKPVELIGVTRNITERKRAEEALAAEKERLAITLRSIGDGVITTDTTGNVVIVNKIAEELTGWSQQEAGGKPLAVVFNIINEMTRKPCENPVDKVLSSGKVIELANHTLLLARDGTERIIADSGAPIKNKNGVTTGVVLVFRDMTEKQKLLETMQRTDKLDSLGILAGGIAHDFNNLLSGVFGFIDLARRSSRENPTALSYLDNAIGVFARAKDLTQQLLTFSKGGVPVRKTGNLGPLIIESTKFALSGSKIASEFNIPQDLYQCDFDKNQIGQVIDNIVINAQQAMPAGGKIVISAQNKFLDDSEIPKLRGGRYVKVSIADTGTGIPSKLLKRIFDPFFTTKQKGNGLGLSTCYSIMQKHDGCIEVESELDKGSIFHLYLPATQQKNIVESTQTFSQHKGCGKIIVMDDEDFIRTLARKMFFEMGYTVIEAIHGEEALRILADSKKTETPVVCAILDLTIPGGMGGKEAIVEIRKSHPDLPVFATSGYSEDPVIARPQEFGFTDSIRKPFLLEELAEILNRYLTNKI